MCWLEGACSKSARREPAFLGFGEPCDNLDVGREVEVSRVDFLPGRLRDEGLRMGVKRPEGEDAAGKEVLKHGRCGLLSV